MDYIELRSDIYLVPTQDMRESILTSQYGDWQSGEDATVKELQIYAASIFGTEAAAYAPSATFANQCALLTAGKPGQELIVREGAHVIRYENGSPGRLARLLTRTLECPSGYLTPQQLNKALRKNKNSQSPKTGVVVVEFPTLQGAIPPLQVFHQTAKIAREAGLHVHIDGARIFSAIAELKIEPQEVMKYCSSLTICLSKGLLAPVGSILVGTKQFIARFKHNQSMLGGHFSKPGVVAGAALIALKKMRFQLWQDNEITRQFASRLSQLGWLQVTNKIETNIIYFKITDITINASELTKYLQKNGVFCSLSSGVNRLVIHHYIREAQVQKVIGLLAAFRKNLQEAKSG